MDPKERIATVGLFLTLSAIDVGFNAAAGPAAVAAGAHVNGSPLTARDLAIGAASGATKSGLLAFVGFMSFANLNIASSLLLIMAASVFGVCVIVTAQAANMALDTAPSELLIAAVVAALPLQWEGVGMYVTSSAYRSQDRFTGATINTFNPLSAVMSWLYLMGWDALGGYTFARMSQNLGYPICNLNSAAAAGGVYGVLSGIPKLISYIAWGILYNHLD